MTLGLLSHLVAVEHEASICVIATIRDGEGDPEADRFRDAVSRADGAMAVPQLNRTDVLRLVREVADDDVDPDPRDPGRPHRRQPAVHLRVRPVARRTAPWRWCPMRWHRCSTGAWVPDPTVLEVLGQAAVLGDEIDVGLLCAVSGRDLDETVDCLDEALDERILLADPERGVRFAHALPARTGTCHHRHAAPLPDPPAGSRGVGARDGPDPRARRAAHLLEALPVAQASEVVVACCAAADDAIAHWIPESAARWLDAALRTAEGAVLADNDDLLIDLWPPAPRAGHLQQVLATVEQRLTGRSPQVRPSRQGARGRRAHPRRRCVAVDRPHVENESLRPFSPTPRRSSPTTGPPWRVLAASAIGESYAHDAAVPAPLLDRADEIAMALHDDAITADVTLARLITYSGVAPFAEPSLQWRSR